MSEWVFTGDKMPKEGRYVLGKSDEDSPVSITRFIDGDWDTGANQKRPCYKGNEMYKTSASVVWWVDLPE